MQNRPPGVVAVLRGILLALLQSFADPGAPPVFYRRYWPLIVTIIAVATAYVMWTGATDSLVRLVDATIGGPPRTVANGVRISLVVAGWSLIGFLLTVLNIALAARSLRPLVFTIPVRLYSWISGVAAFGIGLLIGTSIFR